MSRPRHGGPAGGRLALVRRIVLGLPFRLAVTAGLLVLLGTVIDWEPLMERVRTGSWAWAGAAVGLMVLGLCAGALRWHILLRVAELPVSRAQAARAYFLGSFANNFLPSGFGGDAVRAVAVASRGAALARATTTVVLDRLTAISCLVALAWLLLPFAHADVPGSVVAGLGLLTAGGALGAGALWLILRSGLGRRRVSDRARRIAVELRAPLSLLRQSGSATVLVLVLGLAYQALTVASTWAAGRAVGVEVSYPLLAAVLPVVLVITLVPISLAGFGLREGSYAVLLGEAGVSAGDATLVSLTSVAVLAIASIPGAFAMFGFRRPAAADTG